MKTPLRTALVTGGNRGIGLEVCRRLAAEGLAVVLGSRDPEHGAQAATAITVPKGTPPIRVEALDVADAASVADCASRLAVDRITIDVLVNNAGICPMDDVFALDEATMFAALQVNLLGAWRTCLRFVPGMRDRGYGRVVAVSSGWGSFDEGMEGPAAYAISKAGLNALTRVVAREAGRDVKVNACCPGWVRTDMGGAEAERSVEEGADTIVWLATLPKSGPTGGFFRDRQPIGW